MLINTKVEIIIAETIKDDFVDICTGIQNGDTIFARYPFKFFPIMEATRNGAMYSLDLVYSKSHSLYSTKNS